MVDDEELEDCGIDELYVEQALGAIPKAEPVTPEITLIDTLSKHIFSVLGVEDAYIYGSLGRKLNNVTEGGFGKWRPESDIDVAILSKRGYPSVIMPKLLDEIEGHHIHYTLISNEEEYAKRVVENQSRKDYVPLPKAEADMAPATIYGWLSPPLMEELKKLVELEEWPPPEEPTPIFSTVLQVCDYAFTLKVLKWKCDEMGTGKSGHKKIIIARLLNAGEEELTDIAQRTIAELEDRGLFEEEDIPLEEVTEIARKVVGT